MTVHSSASPLLARRYVTALLDVASDKPGLSALRTQLNQLIDMISASSDFSYLLASPLLAVVDQQRAVAAVLDKAKFCDALKGFVRVIVQNRRGAMLGSVVKAAIAEIDVQAGLAQADVIVAAPLTDVQQKKLAAMLSEWSGTKVGLNVTVSPDVMGGIKIRLGSIQIDDSISGKLNRLAQTLNVQVRA